MPSPLPWVGVSKTREYGLKMNGERFNRNPRANIWTQRVVDTWHKLPGEVVAAGTIIKFKTFRQVHGSERFRGR